MIICKEKCVPGLKSVTLEVHVLCYGRILSNVSIALGVSWRLLPSVGVEV